MINHKEGIDQEFTGFSQAQTNFSEKNNEQYRKVDDFRSSQKIIGKNYDKTILNI